MHKVVGSIPTGRSSDYNVGPENGTNIKAQKLVYLCFDVGECVV